MPTDSSTNTPSGLKHATHAGRSLTSATAYAWRTNSSLVMSFLSVQEVVVASQHDARAGKCLARSAQHFDAFEHGAQRRPLEAVSAGDDRQRQADAPWPMRRKRRVSQRAPECKRADREPRARRRTGQLACFARLHADDRDLFGVGQRLRLSEPLEL